MPLRRLRRWPGSLRARLTLAGVVLIALVVGATTLLLVQRAERATLAEQRERELGETARTAAALTSRVLELQNALRAVAQQIEEPLLRDPPALERFVTGQVVLRRMFGNVSVATRDGQLRVYTERDGVRPANINVGDREYFREAMQENAPVISEAMTSRVVPEPVIVLAQPLAGAHGPYGALLGGLRLGSGDLMAQVLQYRAGDEPDALLVVTDEGGRILAHPDAARALQPLSSEPRLAQAWTDWVRAGRPLEPAGLPAQQDGEVVTVAAVSGPQWLVWRVLPESQLLAPLHDARRQALGWAALMALGASAVLLALLGWLLRPMRALERRAQHLFDPAFDPHADWPEAGGEIGHLAQVLRHASAERAQLEVFNTELLQRLESVMAAAPVGIAFTRHERFELVNAELCRLLGRRHEELAGQPMELLGLEAQAQKTLLRQARYAFLGHQPYSGEWPLQRADGSTFWAQLRVQPARAGDAVQGLIWSVLDISAQVAARAQLQWSAHHDALTGLANRAAFEQQLQKVFDARPQSIPAVLVAIDLDHFKPINDGAGHAAGDAMLKAVAAAIRGCVRNGDLVARLGGDEFVLLLERCSAERALPIADAVCAAVAGIELEWEDRVLRVGASAGVAALQADMTEVAHWLKAADRACYDAKAAGRGQARAAPAGPADPTGPRLRVV
ncbi:diguanylate cyclase domain-containing protein [Azohydromonas aeria]|uniref:diguanylate cyclase domain-containing protein n=1 Tax=Azohydromonas aeria TaxID=2590212 RepID=UPI0018DF093B|nr:diguanylate cyclase [Azohydromonas aeria]